MKNFNWDNDFPHVPKSFHNRLCSTVAQLPNQEEIMMNRKISMRRTLVFAAVTVMLLATTAFSIGRVFSVNSHSNDSDHFKQIPTADEVQSVIDASPNIVEKFDNGYVFELGSVVHVEEMDEDENVTSKYKSLDFYYASGTDSITLTVEKLKPGRELSPNCTELTYGDTTLYALSYVEKIIPMGYEKTEQDKLDEAAGKVVFGYMGGNTVETRTIQLLFWDYGDVSYTLLDRNIPVTDGVLVAMAQQIIDNQ